MVLLTAEEEVLPEFLLRTRIVLIAYVPGGILNSLGFPAPFHVPVVHVPPEFKLYSHDAALLFGVTLTAEPGLAGKVTAGEAR